MTDCRGLLVRLVPWLAMAACGCGALGGGGGAGAEMLRATIDGQPWLADANTIHVLGDGTPAGALTIVGMRGRPTDNCITMVLNLFYIDGPKTYPLGVNSSNAGGAATVAERGSPSGYWTTEQTGRSGSFTVTSMTFARFAGTFEFIGPEYLENTTKMHTVTDGSFELPVPVGFQRPPTDDYGSTVTATVNGEAWTGGSVFGNGNAASGALSWRGTSTDLSISFTALTPLTVGTFDQTGVRVTATGAASWGDAGSVSSVSITTLSAKRVIGTFSATLATMSDTVGPLTIASGTFDVRIDSP